MMHNLKELFAYRDLLLTLAVRDVKVRYRQTMLGMLWAILQPLSFMVIFTLVFARVGKISSDGTPYPLFSYAGLVPWTFFTAGMSLAVNSISNNMNLVKKIYFPREVFPLGVTLGCFVDFLVASSLVAALMAIYGVAPSPALLWLPWLITLEFGFLIALGLTTAALNVFYRDVKYIVPLVLQLGMFVTPVIYPSSKVPEDLRPWFMLNPLAVVIDGVREVVLHQRAPELRPLVLTSLVVAGLATLAYGFFKRVEVRFADAI